MPCSKRGGGGAGAGGGKKIVIFNFEMGLRGRAVAIAAGIGTCSRFPALKPWSPKAPI